MALIAIDLDGTLLNSAGQVSAANAEALHEAVRRGHVVAPATARWYQAARQPFQRLGLEVPAIASAGADVRLADGSVALQALLPAEFTAFIAELLDAPGRTATLTTTERTYRRTDELPATAANIPAWLSLVTHLGDADLSGLLAVLAQFPSGDPAIEQLEAWRSRVTVHEAITFRRDPMLTVTALGADKGTALEALRDALGFQRQDVIAFGDTDVDVPMFSVAGVAVAMANAQETVKASATMLTESADDDGVAKALARLGLAG